MLQDASTRGDLLSLRAWNNTYIQKMVKIPVTAEGTWWGSSANVGQEMPWNAEVMVAALTITTLSRRLLSRSATDMHAPM